MFQSDTKPTNRVDILIGKSARIQGDIDFAGGLHLDGRVAGNVRADGQPSSALSVSDAGCIEGSVTVPNVSLDGTVKGDIHASGRVVLGSSANVQGDVHYGSIETAFGAQIRGKLIPIVPPPPPVKRSVATQNPAKPAP
jgi:cytoskeletal protein CcmA (bactofilin family)